MNRNIYLLLISVLLIGFSSGCGNQGDDDVNVIITYEEENEDLYDFQAFNLKPYGIQALIYLPDATANIGAAVEPEVLHDLDGYEWEIVLGQSFRMKIEDWGEMDAFSDKIEELKSQDIYAIEYIEKTDDFIYYKATLKAKSGVKGKAVGVEHTSYHVVALQNIEGINYLFMSSEEGCSKLIADYMAISVKNVEPLE